MSQLIDGDLAANNGGWQWAASTGTDAAPYFRIFNPTTQERGSIATANLSASGYRHYAISPKSDSRAVAVGGKSGVVLDYPRPIVEHKQARIATLSAYEAARKGA